MEKYKSEMARLERSYRVWHAVGMSLLTVSVLGLGGFSFFLLQNQP